MRHTLPMVMLLSALAAVLLTACGGGPTETTVEITETQFNDGIVLGDGAALSGATVDVTTAGVVVNGTITCPDDTTEEGSVTVVISSTGVGLLSIAISNVDSACLTIEDPGISQVAGAVAVVVDEIVQNEVERNEDDGLRYLSITFTDDSVTIVTETAPQ